MNNNLIFWKFLFWTGYYFFDNTLKWISFKNKFSRHNQVFMHVLLVFIYYCVANVLAWNSTMKIFIACVLHHLFKGIWFVSEMWNTFVWKSQKFCFTIIPGSYLSDHFLVGENIIQSSFSNVKQKFIFFLSMFVYYCQ